jgi:hypothetical protein
MNHALDEMQQVGAAVLVCLSKKFIEQEGRGFRVKLSFGLY